MNQVETWFGILQSKRIRRGVFISVKDRVNKIDDFIKSYIENSKPFKWVKTSQQILAKAKRPAQIA